MIAVACPACGRQYRVSDDKAGRSARCVDCRERFLVPPAEAPAPPVDEEVEIEPCAGCRARFAARRSELGARYRCPFCARVSAVVCRAI